MIFFRKRTRILSQESRPWSDSVGQLTKRQLALVLHSIFPKRETHLTHVCSFIFCEKKKSQQTSRFLAAFFGVAGYIFLLKQKSTVPPSHGCSSPCREPPSITSKPSPFFQGKQGGTLSLGGGVWIRIGPDSGSIFPWPNPPYTIDLYSH